MPVFGLRKQWLDPHFPFIHGFLVGVCLMKGSHAFKGFFGYMTTQFAPGTAGRTLCFERTRIAHAGLGSILLEPIGTAGRQQTQFGSIGTDIAIVFRIIEEIPLPEEVGSLVKIGQGNIRTNVLLFESGDNFRRPIGGISSKLTGPEFPAKAYTPEEI